MFQFTLPHGERRPAREAPHGPGQFQFTLPHGERQTSSSRSPSATKVSIHAPAWGATRFALSHCRFACCFNSRSRMGSDAHARGEADKAPCFNSRSRMGSDLRVRCHNIDGTFQFTLPHGERLRHATRHGLIAMFQFTLPHGERLCHLDRLFRRVEVSIHAPAWGATSAASSRAPRTRFQFTLPHGERPEADVSAIVDDGFNSRSRMGSDWLILILRSSGLSFNSRSRMGSDLPSLAQQQFAKVSIHAPAWGATADSNVMSPTEEFQFTLPHGERRLRKPPKILGALFQFTLPHGERLFDMKSSRRRSRFNSRSRMGSDRRGRAR